MRSLLRRVIRVLVAGFALALLLMVAVLISSWHCKLQGQIPPSAQRPSDRTAVTAGIADYARPEDETYLSYPEWYIVWSYQEKADFQEKNLPSGFPFFGAVQQYWGSYCCVAHLIRGRYPFNGGEHLMLVVIGTSFTTEYVLKGLYEKTIGKISEWCSGGKSVEEDQYAYQVAREYAEFVHVRPFYEFHFARQVKGLWSKTPFWGAHVVRKWERKVFLTADYTFEAFYCWLIQIGTHLTYGSEPASTYAWIDGGNETQLQQVPHAKTVQQAGTHTFIVEIPRYHEFTSVAAALAERDIQFVEVAGNSRIIISVLAPEAWHYGGTDAQQLFATRILTHPELQRVVLGCEVTSLSALLETLRLGRVRIEHVYDY
ncbi:MAG: hypothetical protein WA744_24535 [Candidatus Acidiferrales bacterium]